VAAVLVINQAVLTGTFTVLLVRGQYNPWSWTEYACVKLDLSRAAQNFILLPGTRISGAATYQYLPW